MAESKHARRTKGECWNHPNGLSSTHPLQRRWTTPGIVPTHTRRASPLDQAAGHVAGHHLE